MCHQTYLETFWHWQHPLHQPLSSWLSCWRSCAPVSSWRCYCGPPDQLGLGVSSVDLKRDTETVQEIRQFMSGDQSLYLSCSFSLFPWGLGQSLNTVKKVVFLIVNGATLHNTFGCKYSCFNVIVVSLAYGRGRWGGVTGGGGRVSSGRGEGSRSGISGRVALLISGDDWPMERTLCVQIESPSPSGRVLKLIP